MRVGQVGKRLFDTIFSGVALVLLAPVLFLISLFVYRDIGRPILFRQVRPGIHGAPFTIYKFRTMRDSCDRNGDLLPNEVRVTRLGRFLRATSLDELPELINVLNGSMSLVGPRPLLMDYLSLYSEEESRRHEVRPGITGWAQINGRNTASWPDRFRMDVWYVDNRSFLLDVKILATTAFKVVVREGISQPGKATIDRFRGTDL